MTTRTNGGATLPVPVRLEGRDYEVVRFCDEIQAVSSASADGWHLIRNGHCDCDTARFRPSVPCSHKQAIERAETPRRYVGEDG